MTIAVAQVLSVVRVTTRRIGSPRRTSMRSGSNPRSVANRSTRWRVSVVVGPGAACATERIIPTKIALNIVPPDRVMAIAI